jgi:hypothetical protein
MLPFGLAFDLGGKGRHTDTERNLDVMTRALS